MDEASRATERLPVGIVGASGYSGMELVRLLAAHPTFELALATTDKWQGKRLGDNIAISGPAADLACVSHAAGQARFGEAKLVFLCTPAEVSITLVPLALAAGARVVDLSGAFRLTADAYPRWYGFAHGRPELLSEALYSMPEATAPGGQQTLRAAKLVSNPGCYPTASVLAILPLLAARLIEPDPIFVDAKSGTTGGGRRASEDWSFSEVADDIRAYRIFRHQHQPEIERALALAGAGPATVIFTPHLLPVRRGILAVAYARLCKGATQDPGSAVEQALLAFARAKPFIRVLPPEEVRLQRVVGSNRVLLGAAVDAQRGVVISVAAIDNLVKGAAGQAVQNANLMFGLPETSGLLWAAGHLP
ncbi:MAG: N-acetyl-gamma-glutamyl-phosphate reductase [Polyangia bacterium]